MDAQQHQQRESVVLTDYIKSSEYVEKHGGAFFPTRASFDWMIKKHREELVARGAVILGRGRSGTLVHPPKMNQAALDFRTRAA